METYCNDCPRRCGVVRAAFWDEKKMPGFCHSPLQPVVARAALHQWEEPCISGSHGSGAVFFTGCNLRCCFCQNATISMGGTGVPITVDKLRELYGRLIAQGAHNINLVTPTPYKQAILASLAAPCRYRSSTTAAAMNRRRRLTISRAKCRSICPI